jgi:hypothetical protein
VRVEQDTRLRAVQEPRQRVLPFMKQTFSQTLTIGIRSDRKHNGWHDAHSPVGAASDAEQKNALTHRKHH